MCTILIVAGICLVVICILYFLAIMPRIIDKPDMTSFHEWLYAHRGLHDNEGDAPENSMLAFQKAVDAEYGIELDVQLTKDNVPVVFHDFTLKRVCGVEGKVKDYTYEELQQFYLCKSEQKIPKFEDVLTLVDGKVPLIVEHKIEGTDIAVCPIVDALLCKYKGMYCMESFNPLGVYWYRKNHKEVVRGQLSDAFLKSENEEYKGALYFALQHLLFNFLAKPDFIAFHHKHYQCVSRRICCSLYGNTSVCWTIKSQEEFDEALKHFKIIIFDSFVPATENWRKNRKK